MEKNLFLQQIPLFRGIPEKQLTMLAQNAQIRSYEPGDLIVSQADKVRAFHLVMTGRVKLFKTSPEGKQQTYYILGPGEPFCLCAAFSDDCFQADVAALEKSKLLVLPAVILERLTRNEPTLMFNMLTVISRRLQESLNLIESLSLKEIPGRLATFLIHAMGDSETLDLSFTQRELAKMLGATPETLSRALKRMNEEGILEAKGRRIKVLDRKALKRLASEQ